MISQQPGANTTAVPNQSRRRNEINLRVTDEVMAAVAGAFGMAETSQGWDKVGNEEREP